MLVYPNIDPIYSDIFYINIYWYGFLHVMIFFINLIYFIYLKNKFYRNLKFYFLFDYLFYLSFGAILGAKFGYVIFYEPELFFLDKSNFLKFWLPGRSFYGGLIGILLVFSLYKRKYQNSLFHNHIVLILPINILFGRIANFINGELCGRITNQNWGMIFPHIDNNLRHVSQLYEAFFEGIFLFFIILFINKKYKKIIHICFIVIYSLFRFFIEFFREPDYYNIVCLLKYNFTLNQMLSIITLLITILIYYIFKIYETVYKFNKRSS